MLTMNMQAIAQSRVSARTPWAKPRLSHLAAAKAELFLAGGPDSELTS